MSSLGDPDTLDVLASRYERRSADVTALGARLRQRGDAAAWTCAKADRFRAGMAAQQARTTQLADQLYGVAAELRSAAVRVRHEIDELIAIEGRVRARFASYNPTAGTAPPWTGTRWNPSNLPPRADTTWRDVGTDLGS